MRALDAALGTPWAIQTHALEQLLSIAARENEVTPEALEKYRAEAVNRSETLQKRGAVAILNAQGPLFRRANLFTDFSGATSYDILRRDLQVALDDRDIKSILLNVDSPGGAANGVGELAKAIFESTKPVVAYVGGTGASAAYWLASAASQIVVDDMAALGSIGVVMGLKDGSAREAAQGVRRWEFVSSQSPMKRGDPATEEGASEYQRIADEMAEVFISAVATHRGVDPETVERDFGRGGVLIGARAVAAGMADKVGTFEETLEMLGRETTFSRAPAATNRRRKTAETPRASAAANPAQEVVMSDNPEADQQAAAPQVDVEAARADAAAAAVKADRERRSAIMALPEAKGREALAEHLYATSDMGVDAIKATLAAAPEPKAEEQALDPAAEYERQRASANGAGLGGPVPQQKPKASIDIDGIYAARRAG